MLRQPKETDMDKDIKTQYSSEIVRLKLYDANENPEIVGLDELPGKVNYFIGNDQNKWHTDIPTYVKVKYVDIYPGIDLLYYGNSGQLEWDFIVHPGADAEIISLNFEGSYNLSLDEQGNLIVDTNNGQISIRKPLIYQEIDGVRNEVSGGFLLNNENTISFQLDKYDTSKPLVIDPVLSYSTYLGGTADDFGNSIAVDSNGNVYVTGTTSSTDFPTLNPIQASKAGSRDVFITKINAAGSALVYSTYLGGTADDFGNSIVVDSNGNAYVSGYTLSTNFPTLNPIQAANAGSRDVFITKINATGSALVYSTYLGGTADDFGNSIAVDSNGNAYVTGTTNSTNFPTLNPIQAANAGGGDAFVTKINAAGSALVYSTYLGGTAPDQGVSITVDSNGSIYVTGNTFSTNFPTKNPIQATNSGGWDVFVAKIDAVGSALVYSTYLGGNADDFGNSIAIDSNGNTYVTGFTFSLNFPTLNPIQAANVGNIDIFITKINPTGSALVYSTYLGGTNNDLGTSIAVDSNGNTYVTGFTASTDFPTLNPIQAANAGSNDVIVTKINPAGSALVFSTYLGGTSSDSGSSIALDSNDNVYVTGNTGSTNFPTQNPLQAANAGGVDAFIFKIAQPVSAVTRGLDFTEFYNKFKENKVYLYDIS